MLLLRSVSRVAQRSSSRVVVVASKTTTTTVGGQQRLGLPLSKFHTTAAPLIKEEDSKETATTSSSSWWDPIYAVPLGVAAAIPTLHYEWYVVNEETQLAACFTGFAMIVYKNFGGAIYEALEADGRETLAQHNAQEDRYQAALQADLAAVQSQMGTAADAQAIQELRQETYGKLAAAGEMEPQHLYKAQMEKVLSVIAQEEAASTEKIKSQLMLDATAAVKQRFLTDDKLRQAALEESLAVLGGGKSKAGDPVQAAYAAYFRGRSKEKVDAAAEKAQARANLVTKINAVARAEGFFFELDEKTGQPKMASA